MRDITDYLLLYNTAHVKEMVHESAMRYYPLHIPLSNTIVENILPKDD